VISVRVLVKENCSFPQDGGDVVFATPLSFAQAAAVDCVHVYHYVDGLPTMLFGAGVLFFGVCLRSLLLTLAWSKKCVFEELLLS
jgi:hypothetical protein